MEKEPFYIILFTTGTILTILPNPAAPLVWEIDQEAGDVIRSWSLEPDGGAVLLKEFK